MSRRPIHLSHEQMLQQDLARRIERRTTTAAIVAGSFMVAMMLVRVALAWRAGLL